jgi:hypothetical protein
MSTHAPTQVNDDPQLGEPIFCWSCGERGPCGRVALLAIAEDGIRAELPVCEECASEFENVTFSRLTDRFLPISRTPRGTEEVEAMSTHAPNCTINVRALVGPGRIGPGPRAS